MLIGEVVRRSGDRPEPATHLARELGLTTALADPDLAADEAKRVATLGSDAAC